MADFPAVVAESVVEKTKSIKLLILRGLSGADGTQTRDPRRWIFKSESKMHLSFDNL